MPGVAFEGGVEQLCREPGVSAAQGCAGAERRRVGALLGEFVEAEGDRLGAVEVEGGDGHVAEEAPGAGAAWVEGEHLGERGGGVLGVVLVEQDLGLDEPGVPAQAVEIVLGPAEEAHEGLEVGPGLSRAPGAAEAVADHQGPHALGQLVGIVDASGGHAGDEGLEGRVGIVEAPEPFECFCAEAYGAGG